MRAKRIVFLDWATMAYHSEELSWRRFAPLASSVDVFAATAPEETVSHIGDADVVICNKVLLTKEVFDACPNIRYVGILATGFNNVDLEAATAHGVTVCNAGSYSTDAVAQLVFAYLFDYCQRVSLYAMETRLGRWESAPTFSYFPYPTAELRGKTLGIIGYGHIGKRVAEIASVLGMRVIIATRTKPENCPYPVMDTDAVFAGSDFLTLHCPLNSGTEHLVCKKTLSLMKETAVLINTSRGGTVCEPDLADALNNDIIAAAYVDVLDKEPMRADTPLKTAKNCVITPHIGWTPLETRRRLLEITEDNLHGWMNGNPQHQVNRIPEAPMD